MMPFQMSSKKLKSAFTWMMLAANAAQATQPVLPKIYRADVNGMTGPTKALLVDGNDTASPYYTTQKYVPVLDAGAMKFIAGYTFKNIGSDLSTSTTVFTGKGISGVTFKNEVFNNANPDSFRLTFNAVTDTFSVQKSGSVDAGEAYSYTGAVSGGGATYTGALALNGIGGDNSETLIITLDGFNLAQYITTTAANSFTIAGSTTNVFSFINIGSALSNNSTDFIGKGIDDITFENEVFNAANADTFRLTFNAVTDTLNIVKTGINNTGEATAYSGVIPGGGSTYTGLVTLNGTGGDNSEKLIITLNDFNLASYITTSASNSFTIAGSTTSAFVFKYDVAAQTYGDVLVPSANANGKYVYVVTDEIGSGSQVGTLGALTQQTWEEVPVPAVVGLTDLHVYKPAGSTHYNNTNFEIETINPAADPANDGNFTIKITDPHSGRSTGAVTYIEMADMAGPQYRFDSSDARVHLVQNTSNPTEVLLVTLEAPATDNGTYTIPASVRDWFLLGDNEKGNN